MKDFNLNKIKKILQCDVLIDVTNEKCEEDVSHIMQDSRKVVANSVFFAIEGEKFDGHNYIVQAIKQGATGIVIDEKKIEQQNIRDIINHYRGLSHINELDGFEVPLIIGVSDTTVALQELAISYIKEVNPKIVAITGSTGKTSTRDMVYTVLSAKYRCHKNKGNFNTLVGVPLTILDMPRNTEIAVLEMGMDTFGEIKRMTEIAPPDICIITNIGVSHLERLGSQDNIFKAKMEIVEGLKDEGTLIASYKEPYLTVENLTPYLGNKKLYLTGDISEQKQCQIFVKDFEQCDDGIKFAICSDDFVEDVEIPVYGSHNSRNASLAVAAGIMFGIDVCEAVKALCSLTLTEKRLSIKEHKGVTIIDDSYNASPDSMKAALEILKNKKGNKKIAVLGDMFELGADTVKYHREVGKIAMDCADIVYTVGKLGKEICSVNNFDSKDDLTKAIEKVIEVGDVILVKASRGMKLDEVVEQLENF